MESCQRLSCEKEALIAGVWARAQMTRSYCAQTGLLLEGEHPTSWNEGNGRALTLGDILESLVGSHDCGFVVGILDQAQLDPEVAKTGGWKNSQVLLLEKSAGW